MPNHITNRLKITGPKDLVKKVVEFCGGPEELHDLFNTKTVVKDNPFNFDRIVPMTDDVKKSIEDPKYFPKGYLDNWKPDYWFQTEPTEFWYTWCNLHWGTKWNSYEHQVDEDGSDGKWVIWFDTAWAPPTPVVDKLIMRFPGVRIDHRWADEDIGSNCGIRKYRTFMGKVQVKSINMKGHDRWCRRVKDRRIGND